MRKQTSILTKLHFHFQFQSRQSQTSHFQFQSQTESDLSLSLSITAQGQKVVTGLLPDVDISIREFATKENPLDVEDLFVEGVDMRVFVLNMYRNHAKTILCAVSFSFVTCIHN